MRSVKTDIVCFSSLYYQLKMAGLLFVVTIPTESAESELKKKPYKLPFDSSPKLERSSSKEKHPIAEYGTFKNVTPTEMFIFIFLK